MVIHPSQPNMHKYVSDLHSLMIQSGDVVGREQHARVFPARLFGAKASGGQIEVMIERLLSDNQVRAFVRHRSHPEKVPYYRWMAGLN